MSDRLQRKESGVPVNASCATVVTRTHKLNPLIPGMHNNKSQQGGPNTGHDMFYDTFVYDKTKHNMMDLQRNLIRKCLLLKLSTQTYTNTCVGIKSRTTALKVHVNVG